MAKRIQWPPEGSDEHALCVLLEDVAQIIKRSPFPKNGRPADARSGMPDVVRDWLGYGWTELEAKPEPPTRSEITLRDTVVPWFYLIKQPLHRKIVFARALGMGWRRVGDVTDRSHEAARYHHRHAVEQMLCGIKKDLTISSVFDTLTRKVDAA
jgi:hypothetical protein